jgi:hypothetical protein
MQRFASLALSLGLLLGLASGPLAQPTSAASLKICGEVTTYVKATAIGTGLLTIDGIPLVIAIGATLPSSVAVGADICVDLTTNVLGLITGASVTADVHATIKVCGTVAAYTAATATATGLLKIAGSTYILALGTHLPASVVVGADLCLDLDIDGFGRVADGTVSANAHVHVEVCGEVLAYAAATSTATGLLKIGSKTWTLAVGSHLPASVAVGADLCIDLELDGNARVSDGAVSADVEATVKVCGTVTAYTAATATAAGQLKVAGHSWATALASTLPASIRAGADLCLNLTLNGFAQVKDGTVVADVQSTVQVCGTVTAYAAATSTTLGQLKAAGNTWVMALDADLPATVKAGADLCLDLTLNGFAQVKDGTAVANVDSTLDVCGQVTAYVAATPSSDGSLTIAGVTRKVRAGAAVDASVAAGAYLKLRLTTDVFARIAKASVLKAGVSVADACSSTPAPSQNPGQSQAPDASQAPGATPVPGSSQAPGSSEAPGASQAPGASNGPGTSPTPGASDNPGPGVTQSPTGNVSGETDCSSGVGRVSGNGNGGTLLPSTDALGRATGVIAANAIPLLLVGLLGGFAAWYRSRRRNGLLADVAELDSEDSSTLPDVSGHAEPSEDLA